MNYELHLGKVTFSKEQSEMMNQIINVKVKEAQKELLEKTQSLLVDYGTLEKHSHKSIEEVTKEIYKELSKNKVDGNLVAKFEKGLEDLKQNKVQRVR